MEKRASQDQLGEDATPLAYPQAKLLYENRAEIKEKLSTISRGLTCLLNDATISKIISTEAQINGSTTDYHVDLSEVAAQYFSSTGITLGEAIKSQCPELRADQPGLDRLFNGFEIEGIKLTVQVYLGFLNNNGAYFNEDWDRETVGFVGSGQFQDWNEIPVWSLVDGRPQVGFIGYDEIFQKPMWEVAVYTPLFETLEEGQYAAFAIPTRKCYCRKCLEKPKQELCQFTFSTKECNCRTLSPCPGNCVGDDEY